MVETLSPGVYTSFTDQSVYAATNVPLTVLLLGPSHRGTLEPKFITNPDDFLNEYGKPTGDSYFHYAALNYLKNGRFMWCRRIATSAAAEGTCNVLDASSANTLVLQSKTKGDYLNGYRVSVLNDSSINLFAKKSQNSIINFTGSVTQPVNVTGVVLSNPIGDSGSRVLTYTAIDTSLIWNGGAPVNVGAGGTFTLSGGSSSITVTVTAAGLPATDQNDTITVSLTIAQESPKIPGIVFSSPVGTIGQHTIAYNYTSENNITLTLDSGTTSISIHDQTSVVITASTSSLTANIVSGGFKLVIKDAEGKVIETLDKLSKDENSQYFHETRVASLSKLVNTVNIPSNFNLPAVTPDNAPYSIANGNAGMSGLTDGDYIGSYSSSEEKGLNGFQNREKYFIDHIAIPGQSSNAVVVAMLSFCSLRGDCMAIIDPPAGLTPEQVVEWTNAEGAYSGGVALDSMFGVVHHDWLKFYDPYTEQYLWMPPSVEYLTLLAAAYRTGAQYKAIAGYERGKVTDALDVASSPDQNQRDLMLADSLQNCVNPFVKFVRDGIILFGSKTLQRKNSSTNRSNAVRTLLYIFKQVNQIAKTVLFEPHDAVTWRTLSARIEPILEDLKGQSKAALYDARFVCDSSTNTPELIDQNKLSAKLFVKFMKNAEMIEINVIATNTGADFSVL